MMRWLTRLALILLCVLAFPLRSPAPLVFTPGEGWTYQAAGGSSGGWERARAKDQLDVATAAFNSKDFKLALKASERVVKRWPLSDYAPKAQYYFARCLEALGKDEKAFKEYQKLIEKYPKIDNFNEVILRQFEIATRYLGGQWFKLWGFIPFFPSMDKTSDMYEKIIKNGPYGDLGPQSQMNIGLARERQKDYPLAVKAYERASDRYHDQKKVASDALFKEAMAYDKQAKTGEYDQSAAAHAISTFTDFMTLYPDDPRVPDCQKLILTLRTEQANGSYRIARFYEKRKRWNGALVYYNEVLLKDPNPKSKYAVIARERIEALKKKIVHK
jgi:outer membrane protein assembly factor BamD